jgi:glycosyltransferase involved in cell wall biosynthesis
MPPLRVVALNEGLPVSGVTTWNYRYGRTFTDTPELGVEWWHLEIGDERDFRRLMTVVPPDLRGRYLFCEKRPNENRWSIARRALRRFPQVAEADILIPNTSEGWLCAALLRSGPGRGPAVVGTIHSDMERCYHACGYGGSQPEAVVAVSRRCQQEFSRANPGREAAVFVPIGVPVSVDPPHPATAPPLRLAYLGRLFAPVKRVPDLIPLAEALRARGVDFDLHIAGEGPAEPDLRAGLERCAPGRAHFHGPVPVSGIESFLAGGHVFISVSEFEGCSIAMLEAMGQGLAPVVTDVSGVRDVIEPGRNGWVVPVGDIPGMADRITALAADPAAAERVGRAAWESVRERYSQLTSARALAAVFRAAAAKPRRRYCLRRSHPALGLFDRRWLPNPLAIALRRLSKAALRRPT